MSHIDDRPKIVWMMPSPHCRLPLPSLGISQGDQTSLALGRYLQVAHFYNWRVVMMLFPRAPPCSRFRTTTRITLQSWGLGIKLQLAWFSVEDIAGNLRHCRGGSLLPSIRGRTHISTKPICVHWALHLVE